jgi:hypothetical protein
MVAMIVTCNKRRPIMNSILVPKLKCSQKLGSLISSAAMHLESLGYRQGTIKNYQYIWKEFVQFVQKNSERLMPIFLSEQLFTLSQEVHNMLCTSWDRGIFFRIIKNF